MRAADAWRGAATTWLALWLAFSVAGDEPLAPPVVRIVQPPAGQPLFGRQPVRVEVDSSEPVRAVEIHLDGRLAARLAEAPFATTVEVGEENRSHTIEAVVIFDSGARRRTRLVAPALEIHDRLDLELQQLYLTATRRRQRVLDLRSSELTVLDDGVRQRVITFESGDLPFTAVLLLDASASMHGDRLRAALSGAQAFVRGMRPLDQARLLVVSDRILEISPFVDRSGPLVDALASTAAGGGTALHDYLFLALQSVEQRQGRPVVLLLSDGKDTHSVLTMEEVREIALTGRAQIYWLKLGAAPSGDGLMPRTAWRSPAAAAESFRHLARAVRETGGRILEIRHAEEMEGAFREVLKELREQYAIGYYPEPRRRTGGWRKVRVEVSRRGVGLRYRQGYYERR